MLKRPVMPHAETCGGTRGSIHDCLYPLARVGSLYRIAGRAAVYIGWSPCVQTSRLSASRRFSPSLNPNPNPNQVRTGVDTQAAGLSPKCRL